MTTPRRLGQIICDASYDPHLFVAGVAGACIIETPEAELKGSGVNTFYQGSKAEVLNSNIAELLAIQAGGREMATLSQQSRLPLTELEVYTDSRTAFNAIQSLLKNGKCDDRYQFYAERALAALKKCVSPDRIVLHKVKAHVPDHKATLIEGFHNIIDKNACAARWVMTDNLFTTPKRFDNEKRYLAVLASPDFLPEEHDTLYQLGCAVALQADKIRLLFNAPANEFHTHPLMVGLNDGATQKGTTLSALLADLRMGDSPVALPGCEGADRTLLRHHLYQRNVNILSSRVAALRQEHNAKLAGLDVAKAVHAAVSNVQIKIPLDQAERAYRQLNLISGMDSRNKDRISKGLTLCDTLRRQKHTYLNMSAFFCSELRFMQERHLGEPVFTLPITLQDGQGNHYFDWSTVPQTMIPEPALGFLYQTMRATFQVSPDNYRDPLQGVLHHTNFTLDEHHFAGAVSRLLYGPESHSLLNQKGLSGRLEPASQRLLNLCTSQPGTSRDAAYWCDTLSPYVGIPTVKGAALSLAVMTQAPLPQISMSKTAKKVYQYLADYQGSLEPPQLRRGLHQLFLQRGIPNSRALESAITQHCSDHLLLGISSDSERLAFSQDMTRQIQQITEEYALHFAADHFNGSGVEKQANRPPQARPTRT